MTRFHLVDDEELKAILDAVDSKSTKQQMKYAVKVFQDYLKLIGMDLATVTALPNSELDDIIGKFYCVACQQNGELYCKKTMQAIRFGLQRHFINEGKSDISVRILLVHQESSKASQRHWGRRERDM